MPICWHLLRGALLAGLVVVFAHAALQRQLRVQGAGPCRTIGQAIANAAPGDTIEVGPGRYSDINADGDFDDPGDEATEVDVGCDCVIYVDKLLAIVSRDGAGSALVAAAAPVDLVRLDAAGTIFGKPKHGFTLRGSGGSGLASNADRLTVAGNIAIGNTEGGFDVFGDRSTVADNRALDNGFSGFNVQFTQGVIRGNVAIGNGKTGFSPDGDNLIVGNAAIANGDDGSHMWSRRMPSSATWVSACSIPMASGAW